VVSGGNLRGGHFVTQSDSNGSFSLWRTWAGNACETSNLSPGQLRRSQDQNLSCPNRPSTVCPGTCPVPVSYQYSSMDHARLQMYLFTLRRGGRISSAQGH